MPDALGPITPRPWPAWRAKLASCSTIRRAPGGATLTPSTWRVLTGAGRAWGRVASGRRPNRSERRRQLCRAATKLFQWAMASSAGASARETRIEEAMMMPPVASLWITSHAPSASTPDCRAMRNTFEAAPKPPATSAVRFWARP